MDSEIRRLIAAHGGYAHEIAGCVVAFFNDLEQIRLLGERLVALSGVPVKRCGMQLTFPVSARLNDRRSPEQRLLSNATHTPLSGLTELDRHAINLARGLNHGSGLSHPVIAALLWKSKKPSDRALSGRHGAGAS